MHPADADHRRNRHAHAQEHEAQQLEDRRVDTVQPGSALVDAHGLGIQAQVGEPENQRQQQHHQDHDKDRSGNRDPRNGRADRVDDRAFQLRRGAAVDPVGDGPAAGKEDQGRDHRLDFEHRNQRAVKEHEENRSQAADDHAQHEGFPADAVRGIGNLDEECAGDRAHRADGNILSAAGRRDKRHAHRDDGQHAGVVDDGDQVAAQHFSAVAVRRQLNVEEAEVVLRAEQTVNDVKQDQNTQCNQRNQQLAERAFFPHGLFDSAHLTVHLPQWSS